MITMVPMNDSKRDSYVVMNGNGRAMYSTDNPVDMQEWYDQNYRSPLAWSYSYAYYNKDGQAFQVTITPSK